MSRPENSTFDETVSLPSSQLTFARERVQAGTSLVAAMAEKASSSQAWEALDLAIRLNVFRGGDETELASLSIAPDLVAWCDGAFDGPPRKLAALDDATALLLRRGY